MRIYRATEEAQGKVEIDFLDKPGVTTKDKVLALLVDFEGGLSMRELTDYLGYSPDTYERIRRALRTLGHQGLVYVTRKEE